MMNKLMKKLVVTFTAAAIAVSGTCLAASANDDANGMEYYEHHRTYPINITDVCYTMYVSGVNDALTVREDAILNAYPIGYLYNGQPVTVTGIVENAYPGNYSNYVRINFNGIDGFVDSGFLSYYQEYPTPQPLPTPIPQPTPDPYDPVVYPRVDHQLSGDNGTTWCSLNKDGFYYNEVGKCFIDNGDGTFSDMSGNIYIVLQ